MHRVSGLTLNFLIFFVSQSFGITIPYPFLSAIIVLCYCQKKFVTLSFVITQQKTPLFYYAQSQLDSAIKYFDGGGVPSEK